MINAWRVVKTKHQKTAFSGDGSAFADGRWHQQMVPMVYCSESLALAALETFVHIGKEGKHIRYRSFKLHIPPKCILQVENFSPLPKGWRKQPPMAAIKKIGTQWIQSQKSVVLSVPSVIIPSERNYLLNPFHPSFSEITTGESSPLGFDARMWK